MTTFSILDVEIQEIEGGKTLFRDSLTTFPIAMVILDPYTLESSWILDTADRVLSHFQGADVRVAFVVAGSGNSSVPGIDKTWEAKFNNFTGNWSEK